MELIDEYGDDIKCSVGIVKKATNLWNGIYLSMMMSKIVKEIEIKFDKKKKLIKSKSGKSEKLYSGSYIDFIINEKYSFLKF